MVSIFQSRYTQRQKLLFLGPQNLRLGTKTVSLKDLVILLSNLNIDPLVWQSEPAEFSNGVHELRLIFLNCSQALFLSMMY